MPINRKRLLLIVLALAGLGFGGDWLWTTAREPLDTLRRQQQALHKDIAKRQADLTKARKAAQALEVWNTESLPAEPQVARSVYQAWLLDQVNRLGLTRPSVDSTQPTSRGGYVSITFSLQARGTLEQWTRFLYLFYRSRLLHQIRSLSISPLARKEHLDLVVSIEALVLPGAETGEQLSAETSDRLAFEHLQDYFPVVRRNLFGANAGQDPTDQTFLTGINVVNGEPEAWFTLRQEPDPDRALRKLHCGEELILGDFQGKVVEISDDDVIVEADGERWLVAVGDHLGQAFALPPELQPTPPDDKTTAAK